MGNDNIPKALMFFTHSLAKEIFAELDFTLRSGIYIQKKYKQEELFDFIDDEKNYESLKEFYKEYYNLKLDTFKDGNNSFYFLDFFEQARNKREKLQGQYEFLENEYIIVAFLIFKIQFIDNNIALFSVKELKRIIRQEYPDLKTEFRKVLIGSVREKSSKHEDEQIDDVIDKALLELKKICWIYLEGDFFETLPAFQRIHHVYQDDINNFFQLNQG